ncbi:MAG: ATP-dependent DNA helicase [bacterium LCO1.1]|uniref:ATP-dependent DNA helicase n=1 Tax=Candidatus Weimeria bifida TaxID=2599074 RepID=A0A6N7IW93_9FIRM|nr:ATP-dependent DNA helicase [Candidatus Weimeria bifida]
MSEDRPQIKISVRRLVEFLLRSGDITEGMAVRDNLESMQAGARVHKKIQKMGGVNYHAEVPLSVSVDMGDYDLVVSGRADGIIYQEKAKKNKKSENENLPDYTFGKGFFPNIKKSKKPEIDEIKGTYQKLRYKEKPDLLHLAQAKCYGFIFLCSNGLEETDITVTYCNLETEDIKKFTESYTREELTKFFTGLVESYRRWSDFTFYFSKEKINSIHGLKFPYPYRKGQFDLMAAVYRCIVKKGLLFMMAPTGTGKTLSTVYPAVMSMGEGLCGRIFYLTAKTMTARNAQDAFSLLAQNGYRGKTVSLTSKEKMCINETVECDPSKCPYAKGHFDRINDALFDLLNNADIFSREKIKDEGRSAVVCPYLLEYDLCDWCDNIIGDFNYVFDPTAYLKRFFAADNGENYVFLIDEAHNLPERGRKMFSASLSTAEISKAKKPIPKVFSKLKSKISSVQRAFRDSFEGRDGDFTVEELNLLMPKLLRLKAGLDDFLDNDEQNYQGIEDLRQLYFDLSFFLDVYEELDDDYVIKVSCRKKFTEITLFCIDPSRRLQKKLSMARSAIFFSATLLPLHYYRSLITTEQKPYSIYAESSFDTANRLIVTGSGVTSVYKQRSDAMFEKYACYIKKVISEKTGNYMVFVPSYAIMDKISGYLLSEEFDVICQTPEMKEDDRDKFLAEFRQKREKSLAAFCIAGGIFGEGVDLVGECLIGVIIAGLPLPQVSFEQEILSGYFDKKYGEGFNYAYLYTAVNKVLQSAGRLIRTENDKGVIVLLDDRFSRPDIRSLFPREWENIVDADIDNINEIIRDFWDRIKPDA